MDKQLWKFVGMTYVKSYYTTSGLADTDFAFKMSEALGAAYTYAMVREWRRSLSIANNMPDNGQRKLAQIANLAEAMRTTLNHDFYASDILELRKYASDILEICK